MTVAVVAVVGLLLAAAGLVAVSASRTSTGAGSTPTGTVGPDGATVAPDDAQAQTLTRPVRRYVALGDSFTAGPLIPFVDGSRTRCLRSSANYPSVLGSWLGVRRMVDVSCSGATTADLRWQRQALTEGTDLVTVGAGGNDFGIFATLAGRCVALASGDRAGAPCRDKLTRLDGTDRMLLRARRVEHRLSAQLRGISSLAPDAQIAVVGYPRIFPAAGTCSALPLADGDYGWADRVHRTLNSSLERAATQAGAWFVDTYRGSQGHDACAGDDAWVNGRTTVPTQALAFHPYAEGMRATAAATHHRLTGDRVSPRMRRLAERRAAVRPKGALTLRGQRFIAALFAGR